MFTEVRRGSLGPHPGVTGSWGSGVRLLLPGVLMNVFLGVVTGVLMRVLMNALISAPISALAGGIWQGQGCSWLSPASHSGVRSVVALCLPGLGQADLL